MNINIFDKIYEIMLEYENLLNYSNDKSNIIKDNNINININITNDEFFNYIYKNIKINHNKININNSLDNQLSIKIKDNILKDDILKDDILKDDILKNDIVKDQINNDNKLIIDKFIKKIYKKIILKCHPDKNGDNNLFIKCQEYYEKKFIIGLIYISYIIKYSIPFIDNIIINEILIEIRIIQHNIDLLKEKYIIK